MFEVQQTLTDLNDTSYLKKLNKDSVEWLSNRMLCYHWMPQTTGNFVIKLQQNKYEHFFI